jgi:hypothetical protein
VKRRWFLVVALLFAGIAAGGVLYPIHDTLSKAATILGVVGSAAGLIAAGWRHKFLRLGPVLIVVALALVFALPSRQWDRQAIRTRYVDNLRSYEGVRYVWGGEGRMGIDCSGLPRRAYRDALLAEGLRTFNGALTRLWLDQWWHDAGARTMSEGGEGRLVPLQRPGATGPADGLEPGDVAVVNSSTHVVVYLGNGAWIEADPAPDRVIVHEAPKDGRSFLGASPRMFRWRELAGAD